MTATSIHADERYDLVGRNTITMPSMEHHQDAIHDARNHYLGAGNIILAWWHDHVDPRHIVKRKGLRGTQA